MIKANTLPGDIDQVTVPSTFSVTAIASGSKCRLRLLMASSPSDGSVLPAGPRAELGSLGHLILERVAQGDGTPEEVFDRSVREVSKRLAANERTSGYSDLQRVLGPPAWSRFQADVLQRCTRLHISIRSRRGRPQSQAGLNPGRERSIVSNELRLRGRIDLLRRLPSGDWEIRDYKLGHIFDGKGAIREEIVLQLRCYGLLVLEHEMSANIRLLVDNGQEHNVAFETKERKEVRRLIRRVARMLPAGEEVSAAEIATPGESCADCPIRHRCTSYRTAAPGWWQLDSGSPTELAADVWGPVVAHGRTSKQNNVTLRDAAGRDVKIDRLDPRRFLAKSMIGKMLWFFGLESTVTRRTSDGRYIQPITFHELPADSSQRQAWGLQVFTERE